MRKNNRSAVPRRTPWAASPVWQKLMARAHAAVEHSSCSLRSHRRTAVSQHAQHTQSATIGGWEGDGGRRKGGGEKEDSITYCHVVSNDASGYPLYKRCSCYHPALATEAVDRNALALCASANFTAVSPRKIVGLRHSQALKTSLFVACGCRT